MKVLGETWSSIKPEERSVLTANRVNVQNQKYKKELALRQRGIEEEMKCDNIIYSRREMDMQNRLSRLAKASDSASGRFSNETPFSSASPENWTSKPPVPSQQENRSGTSRGSESSSLRLASRESNIMRHVHFGGAVDHTAGSMGSKFSTPRRFHQSDSMLVGGRGARFDSEHDNCSTSSTFRLPGISRIDSTNKLQPKTAGSTGRSLYGFSSLGHVSSLAPRNSLKALSGLEDEMARWRRLHHTRAVNARIKAVRGGGKRHSSCLTLRETMDHAALLRKQEALNPEPFTAHKAWGLLNCGYLRLTPSNVVTLEEICSKAGYDVSSHPHKPMPDASKEMDEVFQELRESHRLRPDVTSQLKFRQSLLFKRLSEDLHQSL